MFTVHCPPPGMKCQSEFVSPPPRAVFFLCVCVSSWDTTRLSESMSSLHSLSLWWLTAELIPCSTPLVNWQTRVYTQTEIPDGHGMGGLKHCSSKDKYTQSRGTGYHQNTCLEHSQTNRRCYYLIKGDVNLQTHVGCCHWISKYLRQTQNWIPSIFWMNACII